MQRAIVLIALLLIATRLSGQHLSDADEPLGDPPALLNASSESLQTIQESLGEGMQCASNFTFTDDDLGN